MESMSVVEELLRLSEELDNLSHNVGKTSALLSSLASEIRNQSSDSDSAFVGFCAKIVGVFLNCGIAELEAKSAEVVAELCKNEVARPILSSMETVPFLVALLTSSLTESQIQACRAIGNICFDNNDARSRVFESNGLVELVNVLKLCALPGADPFLRTNAAGCFLNLIMSQEVVFSKVVEMGVMEILCDMLSFDIGGKSSEEMAVHIYVILGLLTDSAPSIIMSQKLCEVTVKVLEASTNGELSELCVELLHSQAENEEVRTHLAKAGLCELLIELTEKHHARLIDDDETRNLLKMACDLIIIILNGDASMELTYGNGKGQVFEGLLNWLSSPADDLQVTAVLAMANFARTDQHCTQMVSMGVSKTLLSLLSLNNSAEGKIRLQHALLSALRNLVIPSSNKEIILQQGLLKALYPVFSIPTFPVVFKLLGTLRMVIDGQAEAACELGSKEEIILRLVEWCSIEDHPGVQGEAYRLLSWIIKNSRDRDVIGKLVSCDVVECLSRMVSVEHVVMQAEAFLALSLVTAMRGQDAEPHLLKANIGKSISDFLVDAPAKEVFHNLLSFVSQLTQSCQMKAHLQEYEVPKALYSCILSDSLSDHRDQVIRLTTLLDSG